MHLNSNKQNQTRYHGNGVSYSNDGMGAISPNGSIMPDFAAMSPNAPRASSSGGIFSGINWDSFGKGISTAASSVLDYKIQALNFKRQQAYLAQQQQISDAQNMQSFARQNPLATQGAQYGEAPSVYMDTRTAFDINAYIPYILAGAGVLVLLTLMRKN